MRKEEPWTEIFDTLKYSLCICVLLISCLDNETDTNAIGYQLLSDDLRIASVHSNDTINLFDTCDFSVGEWIFYLVEDTSLSNSRYFTKIFGSPAIILDNEAVMEMFKTKWRMTCSGGGTTCLAYLTVLRDGNLIWFSSICLSASDALVQHSDLGLCAFNQDEFFREFISKFRPTAIFPRRPQRPITITELNL